MIVIIGLLVLGGAAVVGVFGVAGNSGGAHPLGDNFAIFGHQLNGMSTGQLFLSGMVVGVVGMLGLSMLLGPFTRRLASRGSRRELKGSRRETTVLRQDRDRLAQQLDDEHTLGTGPTLPSGEDITLVDQSVAPEPVLAARSDSRHRSGHQTNG
jgi:hypothetical protein